MSDLVSLSETELAEILAETPMARFMNIEIDAWRPVESSLTCTMPMRDELSNLPDCSSYHGGAIAALIDTTTCFVVIGMGVETCPTLGIQVDYLRPAVNTALMCVASIRRLGSRTSTVDADVFNEKGQLVAVGRCGFLVS